MGSSFSGSQMILLWDPEAVAVYNDGKIATPTIILAHEAKHIEQWLFWPETIVYKKEDEDYAYETPRETDAYNKILFGDQTSQYIFQTRFSHSDGSNKYLTSGNNPNSVVPTTSSVKRIVKVSESRNITKEVTSVEKVGRSNGSNTGNYTSNTRRDMYYNGQTSCSCAPRPIDKIGQKLFANHYYLKLNLKGPKWIKSFVKDAAGKSVTTGGSEITSGLFSCYFLCQIRFFVMVKVKLIP